MLRRGVHLELIPIAKHLYFFSHCFVIRHTVPSSVTLCCHPSHCAVIELSFTFRHFDLLFEKAQLVAARDCEVGDEVRISYGSMSAADRATQGSLKTKCQKMSGGRKPFRPKVRFRGSEWARWLRLVAFLLGNHIKCYGHRQ